MSQIDLIYYEGREQAYIKHRLLDKYLSSWGFKIGSKWDPLVFIDGFAGPWGALDKDFADASFGIAINALTKAVSGLDKIGRSINAACIFVEKAPQPFAKLEAFAKGHSSSRVQAIAVRGRFSKNIPVIEDYIKTLGPNAFKFVFLDQKGWAATPINELQPFVKMRSCELLFTVMTSFLSRFVDKNSIATSYEALFGKKEVLRRIRALPKGKGLREEFIVDEYCRSLRDLCGFKYVSQAVILEPLKERIRYYLVFATNSLHGIEVFKLAEREANRTQDQIRYETHSKHQVQSLLPFGNEAPKSTKAAELRNRCLERAKQRLIDFLWTSSSVVSYADVYGEFLSLPIVEKPDLDTALRDLAPVIQLKLEGVRRKTPSPFKNDLIMVDRKLFTERFPQ